MACSHTHSLFCTSTGAAPRLGLASSSPEVTSDFDEEGWRPSSSLPPASSAGALQPVGGTGPPGGVPDSEKGWFRRRRVARPGKSRAAADMLGDTDAGEAGSQGLMAQQGVLFCISWSQEGLPETPDHAHGKLCESYCTCLTCSGAAYSSYGIWHTHGRL